VYRRENLRIERFVVETAWNSAYQFLSLKGVLAERWAHGPLFGAYNEGPVQVTLTPGQDQPGLPVRQATYGLKAAGMNQEQVPDVDAAVDLVGRWFDDVYAVLKPKRTVAVTVNWFALYPVTNPDQMSARIRDRYYREGSMTRLKWDRFPSYHSAAEMLMYREPEQASLILGVVGPPHAGEYFVAGDPDRDSRWWLGLRFAYGRREQSGVDEPVDTLKSMVVDSRTELGRLVPETIGALV
jgi:hypothetical protein